jgi:hypothetical protein
MHVIDAPQAVQQAEPSSNKSDWVMLPRTIMDRLEEFDTACILARAAAANAGEVRHWDECLHELRRARRLLDESRSCGVTARFT